MIKSKADVKEIYLKIVLFLYSRFLCTIWFVHSRKQQSESGPVLFNDTGQQINIQSA